MPHAIGGLDPWTIAALQELGNGVRRLRTDFRLTQAALAERCGLSQSTISRLENGLAPGLRVAWLARLLVGFNRSPSHPGARPWEVETPASWELLVERFSTRGNLAVRMREAELVRRRSIDRLIQLKASQRDRAAARERERRT